VISRFAAAAGVEALEAAGVKRDSQSAQRIALVFAISNGGVIYTKRFYRDIVETARNRPVRSVPETVFNAPEPSSSDSRHTAQPTLWWVIAQWVSRQ